MPVNDYSATPASNTAINSIDIAEGCAPAGINNAIRQLMADIAAWRAGTGPTTLFTGGGTIAGAVTFSGAVTTSAALTANGAVNANAGLTATGAIATNGSVRQTATAVGASDIDCSVGNYFTRTVAGNVTFTFSNPPASGTAYAFTLEITHTSGTITWPASVRWPGNTAPTLTTSRTHIITFLTDNGGTTWFGAPQTNYVV